MLLRLKPEDSGLPDRVPWLPVSSRCAGIAPGLTGAPQAPCRSGNGPAPPAAPSTTGTTTPRSTSNRPPDWRHLKPDALRMNPGSRAWRCAAAAVGAAQDPQVAVVSQRVAAGRAMGLVDGLGVVGVLGVVPRGVRGRGWRRAVRVRRGRVVGHPGSPCAARVRAVDRRRWGAGARHVTRGLGSAPGSGRTGRSVCARVDAWCVSGWRATPTRTPPKGGLPLGVPPYYGSGRVRTDGGRDGAGGVLNLALRRWGAVNRTRGGGVFLSKRLR